MTHWFSSRSLWKTISPVSGSLIHRFSGMSRRPSMELIFGRTKFAIQFMAASPACLQDGSTSGRDKARGADTLCQFAYQPGDGLRRVGSPPAAGSERTGDGVDDSCPDHH